MRETWTIFFGGAGWSSAPSSADRYPGSTAERRWSDSDFIKYGQWRYQRVEACPRDHRESPSQRGGRPRSRAERLYSNPAGHRNEGRREAALVFFSSGGDGIRGLDEQLEHLPQLLADALGEAVLGAGDGQRLADDAGAGDPEHPAQV